MDSNVFEQMDWLEHHCFHKALCFLVVLGWNIGTFGTLTALEHSSSMEKKIQRHLEMAPK